MATDSRICLDIVKYVPFNIFKNTRQACHQSSTKSWGTRGAFSRDPRPGNLNHPRRSIKEREHGTHEALKIVAKDVISTMPKNVVTHILDRLPIQDAVRTSILSRKWRFHWTSISQLVFDEKLFEQGLQGDNKFNDRTISRLLLYFKGAITKFFLHIPHYMKLDVADVCLWVMCLSQKGIKEFTLINMHPTPLKLPSHLFCCLELKLLKLENCCFYMPPSFCSFPKLLELEFNMVRLESGNVGELITRCPLLDKLKIKCNYPTGKMKSTEITKLENLKVFSFSLCNLEDIAINSIRIYHLVGFLPRLQELYLDFQNCKLGAVDSSPWKFYQMPTTFPCLKTLTLYGINFSNAVMAQCALYMIWGSLNLQTVKITATYDGAFPPPACPYSQIDTSKMGKLLQLRSVVFASCIGSKEEVHLIKSILPCSPMLKKIDIYPSRVFGGENRKLTFVTDLLKLRRASPVAEVDIYWC